MQTPPLASPDAGASRNRSPMIKVGAATPVSPNDIPKFVSNIREPPRLMIVDPGGDDTSGNQSHSEGTSGASGGTVASLGTSSGGGGTAPLSRHRMRMGSSLGDDMRDALRSSRRGVGLSASDAGSRSGSMTPPSRAGDAQLLSSDGLRSLDGSVDMVRRTNLRARGHRSFRSGSPSSVSRLGNSSGAIGIARSPSAASRHRDAIDRSARGRNDFSSVVVDGEAVEGREEKSPSEKGDRKVDDGGQSGRATSVSGDNASGASGAPSHASGGKSPRNVAAAPDVIVRRSSVTGLRRVYVEPFDGRKRKRGRHSVTSVSSASTLMDDSKGVSGDTQRLLKLGGTGIVPSTRNRADEVQEDTSVGKRKVKFDEGVRDLEGSGIEEQLKQLQMGEKVSFLDALSGDAAKMVWSLSHVHSLEAYRRAVTENARLRSAMSKMRQRNQALVRFLDATTGSDSSQSPAHRAVTTSPPRSNRLASGSTSSLKRSLRGGSVDSVEGTDESGNSQAPGTGSDSRRVTKSDRKMLERLRDLDCLRDEVDGLREENGDLQRQLGNVITFADATAENLRASEQHTIDAVQLMDEEVQQVTGNCTTNIVGKLNA